MSYCRVVRAIRRFCLDCQGGAAREVRVCTDLGCALRVWRMAGIRGGDPVMDAGDSPASAQGVAMPSCNDSLLSTPCPVTNAPSPEDAPCATGARPVSHALFPGASPAASPAASPDARPDVSPVGSLSQDALSRSLSPEGRPDAPAPERNGDRAVFPAGCVPPGSEGDVVPPLRAIRRFCLHCCGFRDAVRGCDARETCALWSYRFGVQPETYRRVRNRFSGPRTLALPGFSVARRT